MRLSKVLAERLEMGDPCWLLKLRWMGIQRVHMKGDLPWLVRWACRAGTIDFFPRRTVFFPIAHQAGQAAVLDRLSLRVCLWYGRPLSFYNLRFCIATCRKLEIYVVDFFYCTSVEVNSKIWNILLSVGPTSFYLIVRLKGWKACDVVFYPSCHSPNAISLQETIYFLIRSSENNLKFSGLKGRVKRNIKLKRQTVQ